MDEKFLQVRQIFNLSILEYWEHEGPDDPAGDEELLAEALAMITQFEQQPQGWKTLAEFETELAQAEAADETRSGHLSFVTRSGPLQMTSDQ